MNKVFVRTPYNYDRDESSRETAIAFDPSTDMCSKEFAEDCDINTIVRRFGLTGKMPVMPDMGQVGDFTDVVDFHSAMNRVTAAREEFMLLPAHVRERFGNDPGNVLAFLEDEKNRDEAVKLGLVPAPPLKAESA